MEFSGILTGKLALVTGAGTGVGRAVAAGLAAIGANVVLVGRRVDKLEETRTEIIQAGGRAYVAVSDVSKPEEVQKLARDVLHRYGAPSVLVNGAGVHGQMKSIMNSDPLRWVETFMINTAGPYLVCRAFAPEMVRLGWGRIVNVSSAAALGQPSGMNSAYASSKAALNHFTRQLAAELAGTGVTVNAIHPGEVKTEMWEAIRNDALQSGDSNALGWARWVEQTGGDPVEKAANLVLSLLKPESDRVNGRFLWIEDGLQEPKFSWNNE